MRATPETENPPVGSSAEHRTSSRARSHRRLGLGAALVGAAVLVGGAAMLLTGDARPLTRSTVQARAVPPLLEGNFTTAAANGPAVGQGDIRRYRVETENGIGVDPQLAAAQIRNILADKRSWTADGKDGFQLVADGTYDFTVRIASPTTVDRICGAAGLKTGGEVNCDVDKQVMVNVKRWTTGSPQFTGTIDDYRALIINHEVGHRIGHGHEGCPGAGKLAPAMMQQIYGLNGCLPNAWPYTADGTYISGPPAP
ncbi:DUF3152 domain-containing protein [Kitasatospora sp. MAP5-34]|uniref:DUF3152 domain-containing protein n=1 Tax=Kitasatospora sp. MAP5-34 TaxID=3035102 RepID=UPI0024764D08|nr:DUF3152 domain-containing protein [Kitasatospora sp. MAP5-34]